MIIGLTGGIASGKSTVSSILSKMGARIVDADRIAHRVLEKGTAGWAAVLRQFGDGILTGEGEIDRSRLGKIVFTDPAARRELEEITHPLIIKEIKKELKKIRAEGRDAVLDVPLLYETGLEELVDQVWVVYTDRATQLKRLLKRDNLSAEEAEQRIAAQLDLERKRELADVVINNRGSLKQLKEEVKGLWKRIVS